MYIRHRLLESVMVLFLIAGAGLLGWHFHYTTTIIKRIHANLLPAVWNRHVATWTPSSVRWSFRFR